MRITRLLGSFQQYPYMLVVSQLDGMIDQLSSFSSFKFYQSCQSSSGLLNCFFYNFGKQCHKAVIVQRISIKLFHIYLSSCLQLKKFTQGIRWGFFDVSFFNSIATSCQINQLFIFIWIRSISITPWIHSFIA